MLFFEMFERSSFFQLLSIFFFLPTVNTKTSFVKDQSLDFPFPPSNLKSGTRIPDGHLRPLGWQRRPDGRVKEVKTFPKSKVFFDKYTHKVEPVVFRNVLKNASVLVEWEDDDSLVAKYGSLDVHVTIKKERLKKKAQVMTFRKFLSEYTFEDWYLSMTIPTEMAADLPLPECLLCGTFSSHLLEAELWMSCGGTASLLHNHEDHIIHCVLFGRKDFILIDPKYKGVFKFKNWYPNSESGYSPIDMDMISVYEHPSISKTPWIWATLRQGDCIFNPAGHLVQVRSYGRGISYTTIFTPTLEFGDGDCVEGKENKTITLADANFLWINSKGQKQLANKKLNAVGLKHILNCLLRTQQKLYFDRFEDFYSKITQEQVDYPSAMEVFEYLAIKGQRYLSRTAIRNLSERKLTNVAEILNGDNTKLDEHAHDEL